MKRWLSEVSGRGESVGAAGEAKERSCGSCRSLTCPLAVHPGSLSEWSGTNSPSSSSTLYFITNSLALALWPLLSSREALLHCQDGSRFDQRAAAVQDAGRLLVPLLQLVWNSIPPGQRRVHARRQLGDQPGGQQGLGVRPCQVSRPFVLQRVVPVEADPLTSSEGTCEARGSPV